MVFRRQNLITAVEGHYPIVSWKTRVIDVDLQAYFDNVRHHVLLAQVAKRINDAAGMPLCKGIVKASGSPGVPPGGVLSPWRSHLYLTEVDRMLARAKEVPRSGTYTSSA